MNPIAAVLVLLGSFVAVLAGAGLLRFRTPYARFHAAGKASPIAFTIAAAGAGTELGLNSSSRLIVAVGALVLTLPIGVHLLFRAVHRTAPHTRPSIDELAPTLVRRPAPPADPPGPPPDTTP